MNVPRQDVPTATAAPRLPGRRKPPETPRTEAIRAAGGEWLNFTWLERVDDETFAGKVVDFYAAVVDPPFHRETITRRARLVRFGINHLLLGNDQLSTPLERCLAGPYAVCGLGVSFWGAIAQATDPDRVPAWTPATERGLLRLGLLKRTNRDHSATVFTRIARAHGQIREVDASLSATWIDDFLAYVASIRSARGSSGYSRDSTARRLGPPRPSAARRTLSGSPPAPGGV